MVVTSRMFRLETIRTFLRPIDVTSEPTPHTAHSIAKRAQRLIGLGAERKAAQLLARTESMTEVTGRIKDELQKAFPKRKASFERRSTPSLSNISEAKVTRVIRHGTPHASAPGFDGWTRELLIPLINRPSTPQQTLPDPASAK
jgi:hypothetical protein